MALADVSSAAGLVAQTIATIQTLLSNWDIASQEWESMSSQLRDLRKKSEMWEEQLKKSGMMSDRRLFEIFNNANNLLQAEETKLQEKGQPRAARCCFLLKASMLPVSLGQTLKNVSDEYGKIPQLLEDEQRACGLLQEKAMRTAVTPAVPKDARYVRLATTEDSILKSLQDPNGSSITLLHGPSGAGKSTLARAVARHYVDRIGSNDTGFKFDHVALLEFGRDVQPGVQKQRLELIRSLGGKLPSGGEEESPDIDHQLETLLKDSAVLVILDDVWDAEPLEAFMKSRGEKVRYLVTTQIVDLWGCNSTKVKMEIMSLADARKLLAARIGYDGQEIPRNSLEVADKIIREVQHNPLALASVACALRRGGRAPSKGVWIEVSKALSTVLQEPPKHQNIEIFGHLYPSSLWRSISLGLESLPKKTIDLLVFISTFEKTSIPDVVLRIAYSRYCERLSTDPMFETGGNELDEHGAIIQIPTLSQLSGIEMRSWTLHSLYGMFIQKDMEREREHASRSLTETLKADALLEIMEISKEDDMDPEKIIILLCVLYMEKTLAQKVIEKSHKSWELIETWKLRRSAAEKILLLLQDTDEEKNEAKNGISHVHKVYFSYVCSGELHTASFLFLLSNCGPEAAMLAFDTLNDILTSDRTLKWSEEMWEMVVAISSLLGQRGDKVRHVLPASVLVGMSDRFRLCNFAGSDSSEQVIGNLFRAVEGDDFEEEVQEASMIALANLISRRIPMPAHMPRIVTLLLSHNNPGVKVHAVRALNKQTWFEEGRKLVANALRRSHSSYGDEGVTRLTEMLQERASPRFIRWGLQVLTMVDPTKGDIAYLHLKEAYLGRGSAKLILGEAHAQFNLVDDALEDLNQAGILHSRGFVKRKLKRLDDALEDLNQAHLLDPNHAGILHSRGIVKRQLKRLDDALEDLNQAHLLDPNHAGILQTRGAVKSDLKRLDDALEDLNQAHLLDPNDAGILHSRGLVKRKLKRLDDALEDLNQAHLLDPNDAGILQTRGAVKSDLKRLDDALEDLNQAHLLDPNHAGILQTRGAVKSDLKRLDDALEDLNQAHLLDPNDAGILHNREFVKRKLKRLDDALEDLNQAHLLDPNDAGILHSRGFVKRKLKRLDDALEDLNQAHLLDPNDAGILHSRGAVKSDLRRLDDALEDLNQAHLFDPNHAGILQTRGAVKSDLKRLDDALEDLNQAHLLDPNDAGILHSRGLVKRKLKRLDDALEDLNQAHLLDPNDAGILQTRGAVKSDLKRLDDALEDLNQAHLLDPNDAGILHSREFVKRKLKRLDDALEDLNQAQLLDPNDAGILHSRGIVKRELKRLDDALEDLNQAHLLDPNDAGILQTRGIVKSDLKRLDDALEDLNQAHLLDPNHAGILQTRGAVKSDLKRLDDALEDLNQAHLLDPNDAGILHSRGFVKRELKRLDDALEDLNQAHLLDPNDAGILQTRGIVKSDLKRLDDALEDLNQAHLLDPNHAGILQTRGAVKSDLKRLDDALEDLNQAHLLDPNHAGILHSRGNVKNSMGRFSDALADFDSAYVLDPSLQSFWLHGRAHAKARLQDFGGALQDLNKAVELEPNNDFYLQERGVLKRMMGDLEGALADLDKGLELEPNDYEVRKHRGYVKFLMGDEEGARADAEWAIMIKPASIDMPFYNHFSCLGVMDVRYLNYILK